MVYICNIRKQTAKKREICIYKPDKNLYNYTLIGKVVGYIDTNDFDYRAGVFRARNGCYWSSKL